MGEAFDDAMQETVEELTKKGNATDSLRERVHEIAKLIAWHRTGRKGRNVVMVTAGDIDVATRILVLLPSDAGLRGNLAQALIIYQKQADEDHGPGNVALAGRNLQWAIQNALAARPAQSSAAEAGIPGHVAPDGIFEYHDLKTGDSCPWCETKLVTIRANDAAPQRVYCPGCTRFPNESDKPTFLPAARPAEAKGDVPGWRTVDQSEKNARFKTDIEEWVKSKGDARNMTDKIEGYSGGYSAGWFAAVLLHRNATPAPDALRECMGQRGTRPSDYSDDAPSASDGKGDRK